MRIKNVAILFLVLGSVFVWGCFLGDCYAPCNWDNGYKDGYSKCEVDFWIEQRAVLEKRLK